MSSFMHQARQKAQPQFWHSLGPHSTSHRSPDEGLAALYFVINERIEFAYLHPLRQSSEFCFSGLSVGKPGPECQLFACLSNDAKPVSPDELYKRSDIDALCYFTFQSDSQTSGKVLEAAHSDSHWQWHNFRALLPYCNATEAALLCRASQLARFALEYKYCGYCGTETQVLKEEFGCICINTECAHLFYPRQDPSVINLIEYKKRILLAHNNRFQKNMYSLIAGFVDAGETLEQAVHREVFEEAGIYIDHLAYLGSQSWPQDHSLMCAFWARSLTPPELSRPDCIEITDLLWVGRSELQKALSGTGGEQRFLPPPKGSIARKLIEAWVAKEDFP